MSYGIKSDYIENPLRVHFDDTSLEDEYQNAVYEYAHRLAKRHFLNRVVDVGCGSAFKLMKYFESFDTLGVDVHPTVRYCELKYPTRKWEGFDPSRPAEPFDLLICSDVIEHVEDPDQLLNFINKFQPFRIVLSTPERDLLKLGTENGPPRNVHHIREWNKTELAAYLGQKYQIFNHFIVDGACQVVEMQRGDSNDILQARNRSIS